MSGYRTWSLIAVVLVSVLFLAGCGDDEKDSPTRPQVPAGWEKTYRINAWSAGASIKQTSDGGYIVTGSSGPNFDSADVLLLRISAAGDSLWAKTFDTPCWAAGVSVLQTSDGGYLVLADYHGNSGEFWLIKTDTNGNMEWNQFKGYSDRDEVPSEVQPTSDGGYILIGTTNLGGGDYDSWLVEIGPNGENHWNRTKGYSNRQESGASVQQTSDGGYLLVGTTYGTGSGYHDLWLVKTYANGDTHWHRTINAGADARGNAICRTAEGAYVFIGDIASDERRFIGIICYDEAGNQLWGELLDGSGDFWGSDVHQTTDGGFMVAGSQQLDAGGPRDFCLIKFDGAGETLWTKTFGSGEDDVCHAGQQTSDGGYILCGSAPPPGGAERRVFLVKTDRNGRI